MQILIGSFVIIFVVVFPIITIAIYNIQFGHRYEECIYESYRVEDFEGLQVERCSIVANKGHCLAGYQYSRSGQNQKGLLVFAHGLCGGHKNYLDICNFFANNGYQVFAYDATGNGESEGKKVGGFAQGISDLDDVLNYVKSLPEYKGLPIMLMGHSWGAYCVANVLKFHSDVKAVVSVSGFDTSAGFLKQYGERHIGKVAALLMPYVLLYERICWGKYATTSGCGGFANTKAKVMVIHSADDETVLAANGYDHYYERFADDNRFVFKMYLDRGHSFPINSDAGRVCRTKLRDGFFATVDEGGEEAGEAYLKTNRNVEGCSELDEPLMQEILAMFAKATINHSDNAVAIHTS